MVIMSPSPRKAWIETMSTRTPIRTYWCRLPPGRRGLKLLTILTRAREVSPSPRKAWIETCEFKYDTDSEESPSPRKAWIETQKSLCPSGDVSASPSPRKAWIETLLLSPVRASSTRRLPPGRRGLKPVSGWMCAGNPRSPSPRKAWIETGRRAPARRWRRVAFPPEGVD